MPDVPETSRAPAPLVAIAGWLVPGAGYVLIGQKTRGIVIGVTIVLLFVMGMLIAGIRVIDVPGYDDLGRRVDIDANGVRIDRTMRPNVPGTWSLLSRPFGEVFNKPWFVGQVLAGPICLISAHFSLDVAQPDAPGALRSRVAKSHARVSEIGTLYTAVAGMLNLLAIIDSSYRAGLRSREAGI